MRCHTIRPYRHLGTLIVLDLPPTTTIWGGERNPPIMIKNLPTFDYLTTFAKARFKTILSLFKSYGGGCGYEILYILT